MMASATKSEQAQDYTKVYWVEAFGALMNDQVELSKEQVLFYERVLISHTTANNILKDRHLLDPTHQNELVEGFYESYRTVGKGKKNELLTTLFMRTLVDLDDQLLQLSPDDKEYIEEIALTAALKAKNFEHLLESRDREEWLLRYMYAKTPPKVIEGNVALFKKMGLRSYNKLVDRELYISSGPKVVPGGTEDIFTEGWYVKYGRKEVSLPDVESLRDAMQDRSKITQITNPFMLLAFSEYEILRSTLPVEIRDMHWKTKISNITTFIAQMSKTDQIAESKK